VTKEVSQVAAAIGREFPYELLAAAAQRSEAEVRDGLSRLIEAGLVFQRGAIPEATFLFKHALVRDAAHSTLLRGARQRLHAQIAEALETLSPERMDSQPELLAQHYAEAGLIEKSIEFWGKAGHSSAARSAMAEAAAQFQKALDQLELLPDSRDRQRQELEFWIALAAALQGVKGVGAPETGHAYVRARELWEQLGSPLEFLHTPYAQSFHHAFRGEYDLAQRLADDLLRLSRQRNHSAGLVLGHLSSARSLMYGGKFGPSRSHLEEALALYDPISHRPLVHQVGTHPHVNSLAFLGNVLFCLGYPDQALLQSNAAVIAEARRLAHAPSLAQSLAFGAVLLSLLGDNAVLGEWVDQLVAVTIEQGFAHWGALGGIYRGWVTAKNGDVAEGISLLRSGLAASRATGAETYMPHHIALLARACGVAGQIEDALALLDDALRLV